MPWDRKLGGDVLALFTPADFYFIIQFAKET
jgi:hypothetical protein